MRKPTYPMIVVVALASMLAPPLSAFAQRSLVRRAHDWRRTSPYGRRRTRPYGRRRTGPYSRRRPYSRRASPSARTLSAVTFFTVSSLGDRVAGITQCATVGLAGGGMWAASGISIPS